MDTTMQYDLRWINTMIVKPTVAGLILAAYFAGVFGNPF